MSHTSTAFAFRKIKHLGEKNLCLSSDTFSFNCFALLCMCKFASAKSGAMPGVSVIVFTLG